MTNAIQLKVFGQAGCNPCKILKFAVEAELADIQAQGVDYEYVDLTEGVRDDRAELIGKYDISSTPVVIVERNGMKMADIRGFVNVREVMDAVEYAKTAK